MNKNLLAVVATFAGTTLIGSAAPLNVPGGSTVLTTWGFDSLTAGTIAPSASPGAGVAATAGAADSGTQATGSQASGLHAGASTYSTPTGNGSTASFNSNTWAVGDYYQFTLNTLGADNINVTFGQVGSGTGPRDFKLSYSTDGTAFTDFVTYTVALSDWSNSTVRNTGIQLFDLSAVTALNNQASVFFRLVDTSTTSISGGTVGAGGTDRVDDFTVSDGPVTIQVVPEPNTVLTLIGGLGVLGLLRRRTARG